MGGRREPLRQAHTPEDAGRLFVGIPLAPPATEEIQRQLGARTPLPGRGVAPGSWHITLRFLGPTAAEQRERLRRELRAAALPPPFEIRFRGFGAFPDVRRASVVWLGVEEGADTLTRLARAVSDAAVAAGFPPEERPFRPHLTLSRLRHPADVAATLAELPPVDVCMVVTACELIRSVLSAGPPVYLTLDRYSLPRRRT